MGPQTLFKCSRPAWLSWLVVLNEENGGHGALGSGVAVTLGCPLVA